MASSSRSKALQWKILYNISKFCDQEAENGASSGIGAGTALHFAEKGCKLALSGRNMKNLTKTAEQCLLLGSNPDDIFTVTGDVSKDDDVKSIVLETINRFGKIDILVNNAGIRVNGTLEALPLERFDEVMRVNVRAVFLMTQLTIPHLKKTKGCIINVSSIAGWRSFPGAVAYCTSKAAVDQLTRCTALELAADGIRVNAVNPGIIVTEAHRRSGMSEDAYQKFLHRGAETHALGRVGNVEEVAHAIYFLACDKSSFMTGVTLSVDGGKGAMCPK